MDKQQSTIVEVTVKAPMEKVWEFWTKPVHIMHWYFASDDWEAPRADNDLCTGGNFSILMSAKDKSNSFDFNGVYTNVRKHELIEYNIEGGRHVRIEFLELPKDGGIKITETFDLENVNPEDMQKAGWQAILNNFKKYAEEQKDK